MWKGKKVSVILPTYNEKDSIRQVIDDFYNTGYVDEVIVVNNNAAKGTKEEVGKTKAIQIFEEKQGYGYAIQRGFMESTGDLFVISEPDGTFCGKDIVKLLAYSEDFDAVFGTRTTSIMIWEGANMRHMLRIGNILVAKLIEFFFNTTQLTDVGCTYKLISREVYEKIKNKFTIGGSHFGPELMLLIIINRLRFIEIPLNYGKRVGKSSVTGNKVTAFLLGLRMIALIFHYRISSLFDKNL
ncbi:MAG: glycosyl transferase [Candidatus Schekmanbacteria bacterium RIFCSPHIGHO2_02_FULL_38_11]|uniref:Glycosyl transferase n=1 Tax=Candidatus Schekmanbacteria bacterium RIFCSPLOWO2_12_FULL_38_15 TaxID=1817883 RepID=A0A1F7SMD3_9BACT|nr:MAG: glycosyl transferase [Candidatus Schekmanbacteria bacterium GWA2_38_9]OGL48473.1 MAG: glycosyl transferase [Candidatus Schekmanbacteria bacterium RIFCSPLOWO2_02_FULL_38_14]OGL50200.1 MAG: glycosyl transferase [Candidatus Schekmanbacteria bacterium RIFCSPHIGHO2_02_FULL_38_11]OGL54926.1 MAG: glycosyl transferase [Candidatus Schekmanbacteria bacterium RIFCSPLOWO2_12_FULL_38_15]